MVILNVSNIGVCHEISLDLGKFNSAQLPKFTSKVIQHGFSSHKLYPKITNWLVSCLNPGSQIGPKLLQRRRLQPRS